MDPVERFRMLRDDAAWDDEDLHVSPHPSARAALGGLGAVGSGGGRARWWAWAVPSLVVAAALAALAVFSLGGVLSLGHGGGPAGAVGSADSGSPGKDCVGSQLSAQTVNTWRSPSAVEYAAIQLTNTSGDTCLLDGYPTEVSLLPNNSLGPGAVSSLSAEGPREGTPGYFVAALVLHPGDYAYLPIRLDPYQGPVALVCTSGPLPARITLLGGSTVDVPTLVLTNGCLGAYASITVWPYTASGELTDSRLGIDGSATSTPTATPDPNSSASVKEDQRAQQLLEKLARQARQVAKEHGAHAQSTTAPSTAPASTPPPTPSCTTDDTKLLIPAKQVVDGYVVLVDISVKNTSSEPCALQGAPSVWWEKGNGLPVRADAATPLATGPADIVLQPGSEMFARLLADRGSDGPSGNLCASGTESVRVALPGPDGTPGVKASGVVLPFHVTDFCGNAGQEPLYVTSFGGQDYSVPEGLHTS